LVVNFGHVFNIKGRLDTKLLSPNTTYRAYVYYKTTEVNGYNIFNEFSSSPPSTLMSMKLFNDGKEVYTSVFTSNLVRYYNKTRSFAGEEQNEWVALKMGEFFNDALDCDAVEMSLMETDRPYFYNGPAIIFLGMGFKAI
ncbi:Phloem protein, partial [Trema orientale]